MTTFSKALQTGPSNPGTEIEAPKYLCPKDIFVLIYVVRKLLCCLALQKITDDHFSRKKNARQEPPKTKGHSVSVSDRSEAVPDRGSFGDSGLIYLLIFPQNIEKI